MVMGNTLDLTISNFVACLINLDDSLLKTISLSVLFLLDWVKHTLMMSF